MANISWNNENRVRGIVLASGQAACDFTPLKNKKVVIEIENTTHKFSTNSHPSGKNIRYQPIFGSKVYIDNKLYTKSTYGLPFIRFAKHSEPEITYKNKTYIYYINQDNHNQLCSKQLQNYIRCYLHRLLLL